MKEKLQRLSTCVAVLYVVSFLLLVFFLVSIFIQSVSYGFAIYALICFGIALLLNSFISDMRDALNEMERTTKQYRDQLWREIIEVKKLLERK